MWLRFASAARPSILKLPVPFTFLQVMSFANEFSQLEPNAGNLNATVFAAHQPIEQLQQSFSKDYLTGQKVRAEPTG